MSKARFEGACVICHDPIKIGDQINIFHHGSAHEACIGQAFVNENKHAFRRRGKRPRGGKFKM